MAWYPGGAAVAVTTVSTPYVSAYAWNNATGFGTKFADPGTLPTGLGWQVRFSNNGNAVAVSHSTAPYVTAYAWSESTGFGAKYSDPGTAFTNTGNCVRFSPV